MEKKEKPLKINERDKLLEDIINLSIINKLLNRELITKKQYYILKERLKTIG